MRRTSVGQKGIVASGQASRPGRGNPARARRRRRERRTERRESRAPEVRRSDERTRASVAQRVHLDAAVAHRRSLLAIRVWCAYSGGSLMDARLRIETMNVLLRL